MHAPLIAGINGAAILQLSDNFFWQTFAVKFDGFIGYLRNETRRKLFLYQRVYQAVSLSSFLAASTIKASEYCGLA